MKTLSCMVIFGFQLPIISSRRQGINIHSSTSTSSSSRSAFVVRDPMTHESMSTLWNHKYGATHGSIIHGAIFDIKQSRTYSHTRFMSKSDDEEKEETISTSMENLEKEQDEEHQQTVIRKIIPSPKEFIQTLHELSIDKLLILLDKYNITIPPGATKDELINLLLRSQLQNANDKNQQTTNSPQKAKDGAYEEGLPLWEQRRKQRLGQYVETNTTSRRSNSNSRSTNTTSATAKRRRPKSSDSSSIPKRKERPRRERRYVSSTSKWQDMDLESTSRIAKRLGYTAANAAKYATNDLSQRMQKLVKTMYDSKNEIDENGIREARWEYVSKNVDHTDEIRRRPRQKSISRKSNRRSMKRSIMMDKDGNYGTSAKTTRGANMSRNSNNSSQVETSDALNALPSVMNNVEYLPDLSVNSNSPRNLNTPTMVNATQNATVGATKQRVIKRDRQSYDAKKKIYSVYPVKDDDGEHRELEDLYGEAIVNAIDTVGEFVADVTEGKYWGNNTGLGSDVSTNQTVFTKTKENNTTSKPHKKRYWRDRLTERVDYALGVHEDGKYYKSWQDQLERQKLRERGNDAVSIFYGRQKKNRGPKKPVAFWEEDGSLMSLFFGRTPDGRTLTLSKLFERENSVNICTTIFKSSFKTFLAILSYLCRWASCRGALPQPIVVFLLAASALSAPKRRRLMTIGITLVALRTVAEIIHGYVYGNEDWEDDEPYSDDERADREGTEKWEDDRL